MGAQEGRDDVGSVIAGVIGDVLDKGEASWSACVDAGVTALAAPAAYGGEDLGLAELGVVLHELGARAVDLPVWETLVCGLVPLVKAGTPDQQAAYVPGIVDGSILFVPALSEPGTAIPAVPATRFEDGRLTGTKIGVSRLVGATRLVVSASSADGPVVVLVDPAAAGVTRTDTGASRGPVEVTYTFVEAPVTDVLADNAPAVLREHAIAGLLLLGDGLVAGARDLTAGYIKERVQFGRKLAEFQGVAMQIADVFITSRMLALGAEAAAWRVGQDLDADTDLAVAAAWFCGRAPTALQTCHHLHGGVGIDETYPLHHYFARVKDVARRLGGRAQTLAAVPLESGANLELTESQQAFKNEVREYFSTLVSHEDRLELMRDRMGPAYHRAIKQMGSDGWMGVGWPKEYGGRGLGEIEQQIFANESARADVHLPAVTLQTVGPTLQRYGTELQKDKFLKDILAGDVHFAIGYSEPDAGTDLASLRTSAKRSVDSQGDHYVVNGQKMWTTGGHDADFVWLAVRTDPDAPKHKGISVLIVDTTDPGFSWTPIITSDGSHHTNATYYNDVRVPIEMLVGVENEGWKLITTQLNHERVMLGPAGRIEGLRDLVAAWAASRTTPSGTPLLEVPAVRDTLARATVAFRLNELLNWQVAGSGATGPEAVADASASKVFASDEVQRLGLELEEIVTAYGDPAEPETADLQHFVDATSKRNLVLTFGGGVNEVQRELISMFGLGLPRVPR
ncbi:MAG: acyl-CoA dehydrogenase [Marmoricola sp.]|nr:acyl-CoA dehydrogenase [Marmoricola sp.]